MGRLLERQLRRLLPATGGEAESGADWTQRLAERIAAGDTGLLQRLLERVDESYQQHERDMTLMRRSLELSSDELGEANQRLRDELQDNREAIAVLEAAVAAVGAAQASDGDSAAELARRLVALNREQAQTQRALKASDERFELAMRGAKDGLWDWDLRQDTVYYSPRWAEVLGYGSGQIGDSPEEWSSRVHPEDLPAARAAIQAYLRGESDHYEATFRFRHRDGHYLWMLARAILVRGDDGQPLRLVGTNTDISALKQAEVELARARDAAEAASRAKSDFLASMSHELRTPLHAILGFSQLCIYDPQLPANARSHLQEVERAGKHLLRLLDDLIDLARIESGRGELSLETVELDRAIEDSIALLAPLAQQRGVRILEDWRGGGAVCVRADLTRLRQVLNNLLSNAIKYNRRDGEVGIRIERDGERVRVAIRDQGAGIDPLKQSRLFRAFDRLGAERGSIEGAGIGLVLTKRLVDAMQGRIGFDSVLGVGSTFWVELPQAASVAPAQVDAPARHAGAPTAEVAPASQGVLYVEDNPVNLRLMRQIMRRRAEVRLHEATSAEEGLQLARSLRPALVLMDINLPGMDGYQALQALRADPATAAIPVVAVTANGMKGDQQRGLQAGFDAYLVKPVDVRELFALLDRCLLRDRAAHA